MSDDNRVRLGEADLQLVVPTSLTARYEIAAAGVGRARHRAYAAALGACSRHIQQWVGFYDFDPLVYGGRVMDYFLARGVPLREIREAGEKAFLLVSDLPSDAEVKARADFSAAPAGTATS